LTAISGTRDRPDLNEHITGARCPAARVRHERLEEAVKIIRQPFAGPDTGQYVKAVREYVQAGFTHVAIVQAGGTPARLHRLGRRELLPALREL
jgi:hypothetical protein